MFHLVYVSSATVPFSKADLVELLATSRRNNMTAGLTGMLLYKGGNFMQVLEGEENAVRATHARIERDARHRGLLTLVQGSSNERLFPDWSMGFRDLQSPEVATIPGFNSFLNTQLSGQEFASDPSASKKLLLTFKQKM